MFDTNTIARFREKVFKVPGLSCALWRGRIYRDGYGEFSYWAGRTRRIAAHRAAWIIANGREPHPGKEICHTCDVRACVNPEHLFEGTHTENIHDMMAKGRHRGAPRGSRSTAAVLTDAQVIAIRERLADPGVPLSTICAEFEIAETTIRDLCLGRTYADLPLSPFPRRRNKNSPFFAEGLRCSRCDVIKPLAEFPASVRERGGWCRACYSAYDLERKAS